MKHFLLYNALSISVTVTSYIQRWSLMRTRYWLTCLNKITGKCLYTFDTVRESHNIFAVLFHVTCHFVIFPVPAPVY